MELVTVKGATKRRRQPRSLTVGEFQKFIQQLDEPFRTMALLCCCLGLRISECLALKWSDVDWINGKLTVERGIVCQQVDDVKTEESRKTLTMNRELLDGLKTCKQATHFGAYEDWMFASPVQLGELPWSYDQVWRMSKKQQAKRVSADWGLTAYVTHIGQGWNRLVPLSACSRS